MRKKAEKLLFLAKIANLILIWTVLYTTVQEQQSAGSFAVLLSSRSGVSDPTGLDPGPDASAWMT